MAIGRRDREFLRGLAGPKHWREADARRALSLLAASGLSRSAFAREVGLTTTRLAWWERRLGWEADDGEAPSSREPATGSGEARFVELVAAEGRSVAAVVRVGAVEVAIHRVDAEAAQFVMELARLHGEGSCF